MNILIIGGDRRMRVAKQELENKGHEIDTLGLFENDNGDIKYADVILLAVPTTRDGKNIFCPDTNKTISLEIVNEAKKDALILSCGYSFKNKNCIDYLKRDDFCLLNAIPTAEGAIARAITDTPFCIWKSKVLVIGCGRVAKILADRLSALKCDLTVSARKSADFAYLGALGIKYIHTSNVAQNAEQFDVIFNTIDVPLFKNVNKLKKCYLYDLSTKGCIDFDAAQQNGIKAIKLPGLPGKTAPHTAGKIIAQTVNDILGEWVCKI